MKPQSQHRAWLSIYPLYIAFQKFRMKHGMGKNKPRQEYHIGWLSPEKSLEDLRVHLHSEWGFGNHFISRIENGQVLSWRKLVPPNKQYHIRVFTDGEIRGHFEPTPESGVLAHLARHAIKESHTDFTKFLADFVVYVPVERELAYDPHAYDPHAEVVIDTENNPNAPQ
jgi:hypothetical protein